MRKKPSSDSRWVTSCRWRDTASCYVCWWLLTNGAGSETSLAVWDGRRGLSGWARIQNTRWARGMQSPEPLNSLPRQSLSTSSVWVSANSLLCQRGKWPNHFVWVELVCWHYRKKIIPSLWTQSGGDTLGLMPWGKHSPRYCKICSCLSPEMATRKAKKVWKSSIKNSECCPQLIYIPFSNTRNLLQHS